MFFRENFIKWSICTSQTAEIIVKRDLTKPCKIQKGTRQGGSLPVFI